MAYKIKTVVAKHLSEQHMHHLQDTQLVSTPIEGRCFDFITSSTRSHRIQRSADGSIQTYCNATRQYHDVWLEKQQSEATYLTLVALPGL